MRRLVVVSIFWIIISGINNPLSATTPKTVNFQAEVWADNWFALYVNGKKVGEDSVPITTEKSFNSEKIKFSASYPFTIGIHARDFTENLSGLEYIGKANQQIGDGGIIFQIRDLSTNKIVTNSDANWKTLVINKAPLNVDCVKSTSPLTECRYSSISPPKSWSLSTFKDSTWKSATIFSKEVVGVKDGYFDINWSTSAKLIWSSDLKLDNSILFRKTVKAADITSLVSAEFTLTSTDLGAGNLLPKSATCDGVGAPISLTWQGAPKETKSFAVIMNTVPGPPRPEESAATSHAYMTLFNISPTIKSLPANNSNIGTYGQNFQGKQLGYTPPCSQGPGQKTYTFTIYALNQTLSLSAQSVTEETLISAMQGKVISSTVLNTFYDRAN